MFAKKMGDEFVTIEHLLAFLLDVNSEVSKILKDFGVTKNLWKWQFKN